MSDILTNAGSIKAIRLPLTDALTAIRLPFLPVPNGFYLRIKSDPANPANCIILIAGQQALAQNITASWPLVINEMEKFWVQDASVLFASATIVPAYVVLMVESVTRSL